MSQQDAIEFNNELLHLVKGKRVAIVGPAAYLQGKKLSHRFDDYDIVIRPNEIIPQKNMRLDYGHTTDIMFCNFGTPWMPGIERKIKSEDREEYFKKLKLVVCAAIKASHQDVDYLNWPDDHTSAVVDNFNKINKYELPFYWIGVRDYKRMHNYMKAEFCTGMASIVMLLHYPIKELLVSGFTFYNGGNAYEELYCPGHMDDIDTKGRSFGHGGDAQEQQLTFFKKLLHVFEDILKIDPYMDGILQLNHPNLLDITPGG
jgi:hypothetical protein